MKRTALTFIAIVLAGAGCGVSDDGVAKLTWRILKEGAVVTCEDVGATSVRVTSERKSTGSKFEDLFACKDYAGRTDGLRPGTYSMSVELLDASNHVLTDAFSTEARVTSGDEVALGDFDFVFGGATTSLQATWRVLVNEQPASCGDVGGATVHFDATPKGGGNTLRDSFNCGDAAGKTSQLAAGTYNVKITLVDAADKPLSFVELEVTVAAGETKNIGTVEFLFEYHQARFKARMGSDVGDNCSRIAQQEVRISDMTQQTCLAYPLSGGAGGNSCTAGACRPENVMQAVEHLGPGQYVIQLLGYKAASTNQQVLCYVSDIVPFTIAKDDVDLGTIVAPLDSARDPRCQ